VADTQRPVYHRVEKGRQVPWVAWVTEFAGRSTNSSRRSTTASRSSCGVGAPPSAGEDKSRNLGTAGSAPSPTWPTWGGSYRSTSA